MKMEKAVKDKEGFVEHDKKLRAIYEKVIDSGSEVKKGFIKCPECGEEILITAALNKMNEAIENHVDLHKAIPESNLLLKYTKPINIRLALARQILQKS
jgi:hypothetical protein